MIAHRRYAIDKIVHDDSAVSRIAALGLKTRKGIAPNNSASTEGNHCTTFLATACHMETCT